MKNSILYKGLVCGLILLFLTACSTDKSKVDGGYKPGIMYNGEIYWLDEDDSNTTSINEEYVLIGEVNEACDNDLHTRHNLLYKICPCCGQMDIVLPRIVTHIASLRNYTLLFDKCNTFLKFYFIFKINNT